MYFVRKNEEIHLPFKNSEKYRTQALNANNSKISKTGKRNLIFILNVLWESSIHFTQLSIVLVKKNIDIFT